LSNKKSNPPGRKKRRFMIRFQNEEGRTIMEARFLGMAKDVGVRSSSRSVKGRSIPTCKDSNVRSLANTSRIGIQARGKKKDSTWDASHHKMRSRFPVNHGKVELEAG